MSSVELSIATKARKNVLRKFLQTCGERNLIESKFSCIASANDHCFVVGSNCYLLDSAGLKSSSSDFSCLRYTKTKVMLQLPKMSLAATISRVSLHRALVPSCVCGMSLTLKTPTAFWHLHSFRTATIARDVPFEFMGNCTTESLTVSWRGS